MCSQGPNEENYEFFEDIENYIENVKSTETTAALPNAEIKCRSFMEAYGSRFTAKETAKTICEQFINLHNSLKGPECNLYSDPIYKKCCKFLKYWINFKLMKSMKNEDKCVHNIYNALESHITGIDGFNINLYFEEDINKDDLNKMNILYSLYEKYIDLSTILKELSNVDKQSLLSLSTSCCTHYIEARYICDTSKNNNDSQFCRRLNIFESKYKKLYTDVDKLEPETSINFIKLSDCPNNKIISTAVTGSIVGLIPLFGILYKFTPMGQLLKSKIGILNNDINSNDEEMSKISLMEQDNEQLRFQQGTYNIKYQSL
ncbi:VIR protein [Plasmodium vivax]|uniref:VIR protein n=1 Tax=Plasmodium vivax TaxID=5855 RepID=A0A1G4E1Q1_PLAVI|nr:VIR protein [Plasmodium vivax]